MGLLRLREANSHPKATELVSGKAELEPGLSDTEVLNPYAMFSAFSMVPVTYVLLTIHLHERVGKGMHN